MYSRRVACLRRCLRREGLQTQVPEVYVHLHRVRLARYGPKLVAFGHNRLSRWSSHDVLQHLDRVGCIWGRSPRRSPASCAIGYPYACGQVCARGSRGYKGQRRGARIEARPRRQWHRPRRIWATRRWRVRVAARRRRARGRGVGGQPVEPPHSDRVLWCSALRWRSSRAHRVSQRVYSKLDSQAGEHCWTGAVGAEG
jgi:hypothetical protein